jgi:hypothetical protein
MVLASDLTGWWVGYGVGAVVVVAVALLVIAIIVTARRIAAVAEDATRSLTTARERTEALWEVATTNTVAGDLLAGAREARRALGGGDEPREEAGVHTAQLAERKPLPTAPQIDPELGA